MYASQLRCLQLAEITQKNDLLGRIALPVLLRLSYAWSEAVCETLSA